MSSSAPKNVANEHAALSTANDLAATPYLVGLTGLLHHSGKTLLVPGNASVQRSGSDIAASDICFDADTLEALGQIPARAPERC